MWWTDERIRLFKVAADNSTFHSELKNLLLGNCVFDYNIDRLKQGNGFLNYKGGIKQ